MHEWQFNSDILSRLMSSLINEISRAEKFERDEGSQKKTIVLGAL